jgi:hypothetical protein
MRFIGVDVGGVVEALTQQLKEASVQASKSIVCSREGTVIGSSKET